MSKWLDMLVHGKEVDYRYVLEERAAIIEFDGQESRSEHRAIASFVKDNEECFKNDIVTINGEFYLKLQGYYSNLSQNAKTQ